MENKAHSKNDLLEITTDIREIIQEVKDFKYEEDLKEVANQIKHFNDNLSKKVLSVDERVNIISRLHLMRDVSGWLIGDMLFKEENKIKTEVSEWESGQRVEHPQFMTIFDFIKTHESRLGFGKTTAYDYMRIRKNAEISTFLKLGIRKTLVILKINDKEVAEKLTRSAIKYNWTLDKLKDKYVDYSEKIKNTKNAEKIETRKNADKKVVVNSILKGKNIKDNEILLSFKNKKDRDIFNEILMELLPKIKEMIYNKRS